MSREAPVLILEYDKTEIVPGGAGNAAHNVATLGGAVTLVALAGRDEPGRRVLASFPSRVDRRAITRPAGYHTPVKTRILAGGVHSAKQQVVRVDRFTREPMTERVARAVDAGGGDGRCAGRCRARLRLRLGPALAGGRDARSSRRCAARRVPVLVDSRYDLLRYRGLTACTPNESEVEQALGVTIGDAPRALERAGRAILTKTRMDAVLVTRGSRGMALFEHGTPDHAHPDLRLGRDRRRHRRRRHRDGDAHAGARGRARSMADAARLANYAGGLVVMKRGTATVSARELAAAVTRDLGGR